MKTLLFRQLDTSSPPPTPMELWAHVFSEKKWKMNTTTTTTRRHFPIQRNSLAWWKINKVTRRHNPGIDRYPQGITRDNNKTRRDQKIRKPQPCNKGAKTTLKRRRPQPKTNYPPPPGHTFRGKCKSAPTIWIWMSTKINNTTNQQLQIWPLFSVPPPH